MYKIKTPENVLAKCLNTDDIAALKLSSNSYQFKIAMKVGKEHIDIMLHLQ